MGRKAPKLTGWEEYIPTYDKNDEDPDPVRMQIRGMPNKVKATWFAEASAGSEVAMDPGLDEVARRADVLRRRKAMVKATAAGDLSAGLEVPTSPAMVEIAVAHCVKGVENYEGPDGEPIRGGQDLLVYGEGEIVTEVYFAIVMRTFLTGGTGKN